jgi:GTPase SAR1 family protein
VTLARCAVKIIIRGDRGVGKTQLWRRLQQKEFESAYAVSSQIQIAHINWDYKSAHARGHLVLR